MTIGGALSELNNLLKSDIPVYYKPSIKAVMDTIVLSSSDMQVIYINGEKYVTKNPAIKTEHKDGEISISGFYKEDTNYGI